MWTEGAVTVVMSLLLIIHLGAKGLVWTSPLWFLIHSLDQVGLNDCYIMLNTETTCQLASYTFRQHYFLLIIFRGPCAIAMT